MLQKHLCSKHSAVDYSFNHVTDIVRAKYILYAILQRYGYQPIRPSLKVPIHVYLEFTCEINGVACAKT